MKKTITFLTALLLAFAVCACGGNESKPTPVTDPTKQEEVPVYTTDKSMMFGMWIGVPGVMPVYEDRNGEDVLISDGAPLSDEKFREYYRDIKDAGFSIADIGYYGVNYDTNLRALAMAEEMGLKQLVYDAELLRILENADGSLTDDRIIRVIKVQYKAYLDSPAFAGIRVRDEPAYDEIPKYEHMCDLWNQIAPGTIFYMNLLPVVASKTVTAEDYRDYIKQYVNYVDTPYVSYDHYVLKTNGRQNTVDSSFLVNFKNVRQAAPDRDAWVILLAIKHLQYRELTSAADCGFQAYSAMAFGFTGVSWFCFWPPVPFDGAVYFGNGAYDRRGNKTPTYDYIKDTQLEIRKFENIYLNFDWKGILTVIGEENDNGGENAAFASVQDAVIESERVKSVKAQQDTLVGVFKDGAGRDGYMVVNYTEPSAGLKNKVTLSFNNCTRAVVVTDGVEKVVDAANGVVEFTQNAGDGTFVIPLK